MTYFNDKAGLFQLLVFPLVTITLFSYLLGGSGFDGMRIAVVDLAGNEASRSAVLRLEEANLAPEQVNEAGLDRAITHGSLLGGILLPEGYPEQPARIYLSPVQSGVSRSLGRLLEGTLAGGGGPPPMLQAVPAASQPAGASAGAALPLPEVVWGHITTAAEPVNTASAGYIILTLFFIVVNLGRALLMEQEAGVFRRMQGTPINGTLLFVGKWLPAWLISFIQGLVFVTYGHFALGLDVGSFATALPTIVTIAGCASALGLHLGSFAKTETQVTAIGVGASLSLAALGGCFAPLYLLPKWLQLFSWVIPQHWALVALQQGIAYESGLVGVLPYLGILAVFTLLFATLGARQFNAVLRKG